jgi:glutathione synthase/RimK-type ligase-like ATP-grasp enzyme
MYSEHNIWVLKPNNCNRGRGISVFNRLEDFKRLVQDEPVGIDGNRTNLYVIQKYIEKPMLIRGRKFDIRIWVLVTQDLDCY